MNGRMAVAEGTRFHEFHVTRTNWYMRRLWRIAPLLPWAVLSTACGNSSELTWTEDIRLPDGRVLTLERWVEFKGGSSHRGDPSTESSQRLEFKHPETGELIKWQNNMEQGRLKTVALWLDQGRPILLGEPAYGGDSYKYHCPNPPYLLYEYVAGRWHPKPLSKIPVKQIRANVTTHPMEARKEIEWNKRHLTAEQTSNSYTNLDGVHRVPYIIQFEGMPEQTFKQEDCSRVSNLKNLVSIKGK